MDSYARLLSSIFRPFTGTCNLITFSLLVSWIIPQVLAFNLDGSPGSFAQFPPWEPCSNGSFSFEFKTDESNSLILYLNKGEHSFYELKLHKGRVCLRIRDSESTLNIRNGQSLNDGNWHSVTVKEKGLVTYLIVDKVETSSRSPGPEDRLHPAVSNETFLFIGGLPKEWNKRARTLALPSVIYEPRFRGSIRNLIYHNCGGDVYRPSMLGFDGLLTRKDDLCEIGNPCLNGGRCLTTDSGLYCHCAHTGYKGDRCEIQEKPSDATFLGTQYISYNLSRKGDVMVSNQDTISLDFRTKQLDSLLFYTGNSKDHITVGLNDGGIFLTVDLGSGTYETVIRPSQGRFNDNRWHQLVIKRDAKEVTVEVDGMYHKRGSTSGKYVRLSSSVLFVAGSPDTDSLTGSKVRTNFKGCMRKVRYEADSIRLDLTDIARQRHSLLTVYGDVIFDKCQELVDSQPVTFTSPESYVTVSTWDGQSSKGSLAFQFRTVEKGGLMLYSNGNMDSHDFFALELVDGHLYLVVDMGSGVERVQANQMPVSDGKPHDVYYEFNGNKGYVSVDGQKAAFSSSRVSDRFDLHGQMFVGGVGSEVNGSSLPYEVWSPKLGQSYVGCLQDLVVNKRQVDLMAAAKIQNRSDVQGYCRKLHDECASRPCNHGGACVEGWNRFTCDCRATGFMGSVCQTASTTLRFDGTQYMRIHMPREMVTQAEDISLRFRTIADNGLLFETLGQATDSYKLYLRAGVLYLSINVGGSEQVLSVGHQLNDDRWHTVFITRRLHTVHLSIDQDRPVIDQVRGMASSLTTLQIFIGHRKQGGSHRERHKRTKRSNYQQRGQGLVINGFVGSMQSLAFNRNHFFEMAKDKSNHDMDITAHVSSDEYVVRDPVTFNSVEAYAVLPTLQIHAKFIITFLLKTTEADGLLFYNAGKGRDFFGMELSQGFLYYVYNMGEGAQRVKANTNRPINDNQWHEIQLSRIDTFKQFLRVDNSTPTVDDITGNRNTLFDLQNELYVGGVRKTMYPSLPQLIQARHGFVGCIGSLNLDGYLPNLIKEARPIHAVGDGCRGPEDKCLNESCANKGRCVQQWTSHRCDCDMTSYTGDVCTEESTTYRFGPGQSLMSFTFPEGKRPSTNTESVAFGLMSYQEDAIILRMDSVIYDDFIQFELLKGNIYVTYNMGTFDHPIGNFNRKVNDGSYHVVVFTRNGANATLTIDNMITQEKRPTGRQAHMFNQQAHIRVGGKLSEAGNIDDQYEGTISGLVINGLHLFELANDNDARITLTGNAVRQLGLGENSETSNGGHGGVDIDQMQSTQGRYETMEISLPYQYFLKKKESKTKRLAVQSSFSSTYSKRNDSRRRKIRRRRHLSVGINKLSQKGRSLRSSLNTQGTWRENDNKQKPAKQESVIKALKKVLSILHSSPEWKNEKNEKSNIKQESSNSKIYPQKPDAGWNNMNTSCQFCGSESKRKSQEIKPSFGPTLDSYQNTLNQPRWSKQVAEKNMIWSEFQEQRESVEEVHEDDTEHSEDVIEKVREYYREQKDKRMDRQHNDDDEDNLNEREGSGWFSSDDFVNVSQWVVQHKMGLYQQESSTIISPFLTPSRTKASVPTTTIRQRVHWNFFPSHTTPRDGVTDDIIYAGSGCQSDDEDSCTPVGSGNDIDDIITPVIFVKSTTPPSTTTTSSTTKIPKPCRGHECETSSKLEQHPNKTSNTGHPYEPGRTPNPDGINGQMGESTAKPGKTKDKDDDDEKGINLALILGIIGSVLVAIIVLCVAWCKLRSRDEGTYKVDETQNFSALQSKKSHGNGALMAGSESGTGKRGKKKDVKEWYV